MTDPDLAPKPAADSRVTLTQMMEVTDANVAGNVHGGAIMRLVDTAAALAAIRHAGRLAVTVSLDEMTFREPVHIGDVLTIHASVNDVGTTSMECGVRVEAENPITGSRVHAASAYLVFVAIDDDGRPRPVPPLLAESENELRRQREAKLRAVETVRAAGGRRHRGPDRTRVAFHRDTDRFDRRALRAGRRATGDERWGYRRCTPPRARRASSPRSPAASRQPSGVGVGCPP